MNKAQEIINTFNDISERSLIDKLDKFAGTHIKPGRNVIKGYPVDIEDSGEDFISMDAVDRSAATGLLKELRKAGFKVSRDSNVGITIK